MIPIDDYQVGYRKPPDDTKFKPGQSGNPRGRPKTGADENDLEHLFIEELHKPIVVNVNGRRKAIAPWKLIARNIVKKSANGDKGSIMLLKHFTELKLISSADKARKRDSDKRYLDQLKKELEELWLPGAEIPTRGDR